MYSQNCKQKNFKKIENKGGKLKKLGLYYLYTMDIEKDRGSHFMFGWVPKYVM